MSLFFSLCSEVVKETNFFDTGLALMYIASGALGESKTQKNNVSKKSVL